MMAEIDALNEKWEKEGEDITSKNTFIGSLHAAALYPSLDTRRCAKLCGQKTRDRRSRL